ncbi:hypothetical protein MMC30_000445 [Trapelia coarctata]|nr:hypothetical protein [Trapelia coarctata]
MTAPPNRLSALPDELLSLILSHLSTNPPSLSTINDEPSTPLPRPNPPLKSLSLTSHRFRAFTTPSLFAHARVTLTSLSFKDPYPLSPDTHKPHFSEVESLLRFLSLHSLSPHVRTLLLSTSQDLGHSVPNLLPTPHEPVTTFSLGDFWPTLFASIRPSIITLLAPPPTLAFFASCGIYVGDAWAFNTPFHLLQLRLDSNQQGSDYPAPAPTGTLFGILPWTHCTLNEGSSLAVYNTYEYHSMVAPSIFNGRLRDTPSLPPRTLTALKSFDYIAIFPLYGQVAKVLSFLFILPQLQRVRTQLAPKRENRILEDASRVLRTLYSDLWMEFENTYFLIATNIVQAEWRSPIDELVCLDYQQEGLWESLGHGGEVMSEHWKTLGDGHWIKNAAEEEVEEAEAEAESPEPDAFGMGHMLDHLPDLAAPLPNDAATIVF